MFVLENILDLILYFQEASYVASSKNNMKGKDVSHLQKSVLDQLAYLDDDSDDDFGDLDDMFSPGL